MGLGGGIHNGWRSHYQAMTHAFFHNVGTLVNFERYVTEAAVPIDWDLWLIEATINLTEVSLTALSAEE